LSITKDSKYFNKSSKLAPLSEYESIFSFLKSLFQFWQLFISMQTIFTFTEQNDALLRILTNDRRLHIFNYLLFCKIATNGVVARKLQLLPSQVSKDLKLIQKAGLIKREKIGTQQIYFLQEARCRDLQSFFIS
jgi:DNA-binding transcriptional ArsR family regulator